MDPEHHQAVAIVESQSAFGQTRFEKNYLFHVVPLSVPGSSEIPTAYSLEQNYPNPFNPTTTIRYGLPQRSFVLLRIFNALGQQVAIVEQGEQQAGFHETRFDGTGLSSGVYFCRLQAGEFMATKKLLLIR